MSGPPAKRPRLAPTSPTRVRHAERQARALTMRIAGASSEAIARELGIHRTTAWRLIEDALASRREEAAEHTATLRAIEIARAEEAIASLRPAALAGDLGAHRMWWRWAERLARLADLDLHREEVLVAPEIVIITALPPPPPEPERTVDGEFEVVEPAALEPGPDEDGGPGGAL